MNSLRWKREIAKFYSLLPVAKKSRKIILIYHAVGTGPWAISTDIFKQQIQWLNENCKIVPITKLLTERSQENKIQVALTFDDGYACLYDTVLPILNAVKAVGTVYLNTGWINQESRKTSCPDLGHYPGEQFLTWNEVVALDEAGWEIGSHGVEHIDLTIQSSEVIRKELHDSKKEIEKQLKKPCHYFAYTFGRHSKLVRDAVGEAHYHYAVAAHHQSLLKSDDKVALPRLNVELGYSMDDFQSLVKGKWDFMGSIHRIKRMVCA